MQSPFSSSLKLLAEPANREALTQISRGIERECLRITPQGKLAVTEHPPALGAALTHPYITTDYAEMLMEFITPVAQSITVTLQQLEDIHKYSYRHLGEDLLWPLSMPCFVGDVGDIHIARYGSSHIGQMKTLYRKGLTQRYGGGMQIISGVHYNFSVPQAIWEQLAAADNTTADAHYISRRYFDLIRNYKRICWVIPYLFGASPAVCKSFLKHAEGDIEFKEHGKGTLYRPYSTSLRMSDLGYTNREQADLKITYNSVEEYIHGLRRAITTPSRVFGKLGIKVDGEYQQLNDSILQIENEFYAPIRPKRVARAGETPTQALERGGVEYIEVRALDVNPFSPIGITAQQIRLLDLLLMYCLLRPSPRLSLEQQQEADRNFNRVVLDGRNPRLSLLTEGYERPIADWLEELFADFQDIAAAFDGAHGSKDYQQTVAEQYRAVLNPELTLSGQFLRILKQENIDNNELGMQLARQYRDAMAQPLSYYSEADFSGWTELSLQQQREREQADAGSSFDDFLTEYFRRAACASPECL
ncbi:glutamate--cysteine ligase [Pseudidiomarina sp.]|uniref:glutamate--cysteine ligase n=1 Tax=Pseudidiomarina sp. TaxID=2081707 RepID=UPI00299E8D77|nr:glutamate--cysteine ligase [Pseudidiomarina sp.]MDX1706108.1 glutamate--cysteine ligase [Pseudidiomarina sp.]